MLEEQFRAATVIVRKEESLKDHLRVMPVKIKRSVEVGRRLEVLKIVPFERGGQAVEVLEKQHDLLLLLERLP